MAPIVAESSPVVNTNANDSYLRQIKAACLSTAPIAGLPPPGNAAATRRDRFGPDGFAMFAHSSMLAGDAAANPACRRAALR